MLKLGPVPPITRWLAALSSAGCDYRPAPYDIDVWQAQCPCHEDTRPSLSITRNEDGSIYFRCWAGCQKEDILAALDLDWRSCWDQAEHDPGRARFTRPLLPAHLRRAMQQLLDLDRKACDGQ